MQRKILFVDDDPILRRAVQLDLESLREQFVTVVAADGFEAVKKLQSTPFSLLVCDLVMPRMDGISLINHVRENYADIPVIVVSGVPAERMRQLAEAPDILAYITKPYQPEDFAAEILAALRREAEGGIMYDVSPAVFLQFVEMDGRTCTIRVLDKSGRHGGMLYFIDGNLVDARIDNLHGMDAALKLFTWETVTLFLRNDCPPRPNVIDSGLQPIIMKAAGMRDEADTPETVDPDEVFADPDDAVERLFPGEGDEEVEGAAEILAMLRDKAGYRGQAADIVVGNGAEKAIASLHLLEKTAGLGEFRAGRIEDGRSSRLLLATPRPALVSVPTKEAERLLTLLKDNSRKGDDRSPA